MFTLFVMIQSRMTQCLIKLMLFVCDSNNCNKINLQKLILSGRCNRVIGGYKITKKFMISVYEVVDLRKINVTIEANLTWPCLAILEPFVRRTNIGLHINTSLYNIIGNVNAVTIRVNGLCCFEKQTETPKDE